MIKNKFIINPVMIPICLGLAVFWMVAGFDLLDPRSLSAFQYSDNFQHHLSSVFFRNSPWLFPLGANPQYGLIDTSTLVYADPVPLMAVLFKLFTPWIPPTYQYLGIWTLFCLVMQGVFAWKLAGLLTKNIYLQTLSTCFFLLTPYLLIRVGMHAALVGQFLILAALYLTFSKKEKRHALYWLILLALSASINFYLFFLVFTIWAAHLADGHWSQKNLSTIETGIEFLVGCLVILLIFWQFGYFVGQASSIAAGGYGHYQMNLLGPIDPQGWSYLYQRLIPPPPNIEGFVYLGLGVLFLIPFTLLKKVQDSNLLRSSLLNYRFLAAALICLIVIALSNRIIVGKYLFEYPLPDMLFALGGVVRSSGRMFWPIGYVLLLSLLALIIKKFPPKQAIYILTVGLILQIFDTSAGWWPARAFLNQRSTLGMENQYSHPFWKAAAQHYPKIISIIPQKLYDESWNWIPVAKFAADNKLGTNSAYLSRIVPLENRPINNSLNESNLDQGKYDVDSLYILSEQKILPVLAFMNPDKDLLVKLDGVVAFAPNYKQCKECIQIDSQLSIYQKITPTSLNQQLLFNRSSPYAHLPYLLEGWAYPESWGTWSISTKASIALPIPKNHNPSVLELTVRALISATHPEQRVRIWVNGVALNIVTLKNEDKNKIKIALNSEDLKKDYLIIGFNFLDPISPNKIGLSNDIRTLSIGLISGYFK